jgi:hypothetical protein
MAHSTASACSGWPSKSASNGSCLSTTRSRWLEQLAQQPKQARLQRYGLAPASKLTGREVELEVAEFEHHGTVQAKTRVTLPRVNPVVLLLVTVMVWSAAPPARAWDDFGHMQVAALAYDALTPQAKARAAVLLRLNPSYPNWIVGVKKKAVDKAAFVRAATWADAIKNPRAGYKRDEQTASTAAQNIGYTDRLNHPYWHYIDIPFSPDDTPLTPLAAPNAQTQIAAFRAVLAAAEPSDDLKSYDLSWLLHLIGDLHQPLHCASRFDREDPTGDQGGNTVAIAGNQPPPICDDSQYCPFGPPSNLHAFFDTLTGDSYGLSNVYTTARELPRPKAQLAAILDEAAWVTEGAELAKSSVYTGPIDVGRGPFTIDAAYQRASITLAKQQISLAGARLARVLNDCFEREAAAKRIRTHL